MCQERKKITFNDSDLLKLRKIEEKLWKQVELFHIYIPGVLLHLAQVKVATPGCAGEAGLSAGRGLWGTPTF